MPDPARHKRQYRSFTVEAKNAFWRKPMTCLERGELGALLRCEDIWSSQVAKLRRHWALTSHAATDPIQHIDRLSSNI